MRQCECEFAHEAHSPGACVNYASETLTSENGRVEFCSRCAVVSIERGYRFELIDIDRLVENARESQQMDKREWEL